MTCGEGSTPIYMCSWLLWCCHMTPSTLFFIKYLSLEFSLFLSNHVKYLILENSCLGKKHVKSTLLQFPNYSRTFSSMHCYFQHWWWYLQWEGGHWMYLISSTSWLFSLFLPQWSSPTFSSLLISWYMNQTNFFRFCDLLILL